MVLLLYLDLWVDIEYYTRQWQCMEVQLYNTAVHTMAIYDCSFISIVKSLTGITNLYSVKLFYNYTNKYAAANLSSRSYNLYCIHIRNIYTSSRGTYNAQRYWQKLEIVPLVNRWWIHDNTISNYVINEVLVSSENVMQLGTIFRDLISESHDTSFITE